MHLSKTYYVKNIFREMDLMIPSYKLLLKRKKREDIFYLQGFDSHTYLDPCKKEECFKSLIDFNFIQVSSQMTFLLHAKR